MKTRKPGKRSLRLLTAVLCLLLPVLLLTACGSGSGKLDTKLDWYAKIDVKDYGTITVKLEPKDAPLTCANFVSLAQDGFYNGLTFHRILEGFMIQGGDPLGNGTGGSGTNIKGEFSSNGVKNPLKHTRGAISMARAKNPDTASSQFFIMQETWESLDGQYAAFGYVTEGMEVVDAIAADARPLDKNGTIARDEQPVISSVTVWSQEKQK